MPQQSDRPVLRPRSLVPRPLVPRPLVPRPLVPRSSFSKESSTSDACNNCEEACVNASLYSLLSLYTTKSSPSLPLFLNRRTGGASWQPSPREMALCLCPAALLVLSPSALLRKMHGYHTREPALSRSQPEFEPDERHRPLREMLAAMEAEALSENVAAKGTGIGAAEISSMGPMYQRAATDGELLEEGVDQLLDVLRPSPHMCFADLGSGRAGALLHVAARGVYRGCIGIELVEARHRHAMRTLERADAEGMLKSTVRLHRGDLFDIATLAKEEISSTDPSAADTVRLRDVTHVFACSVCYDDVLLHSISNALSNRQLFPNFQVLVSLRALPSNPAMLLAGEIRLTTSWNGSARARVYIHSDVLSHLDDAAVPVQTLAWLLCSDGVCTLPPGLQWPKGSVVGLPRL